MCCQSKTLILSLLEFSCKYQLFWTNFKSPPPWKIIYKQPTDIHCIVRVVSRTSWLLPLFYERQFKQCWLTIPPISTKTNTVHLNSLNTKRPWNMTLEIQVIVWHRHKNVAVLNRIIWSQPFIQLWFTFIKVTSLNVLKLCTSFNTAQILNPISTARL
jgi:hypothetical protein